MPAGPPPPHHHSYAHTHTYTHIQCGRGTPHNIIRDERPKIYRQCIDVCVYTNVCVCVEVGGWGAGSYQPYLVLQGRGAPTFLSATGGEEDR
mmetsp:Transcript_7414/g.19216  ORF Transcript_7414/g.19216 Transcript_7414/m.19216 type:complete len:92 (+) Transcript_7414:898-1173(+)